MIDRKEFDRLLRAVSDAAHACGAHDARFDRWKGGDEAKAAAMLIKLMNAEHALRLAVFADASPADPLALSNPFDRLEGGGK